MTKPDCSLPQRGSGRRGRGQPLVRLSLVATLVAATGSAALAGDATSAGSPEAAVVRWPDSGMVEPSTPLASPGTNVIVDGSLPRDVRPGILRTSGPSWSGGVAADVSTGSIPVIMLGAYRHAAELEAHERPGCHVDWALIAAVGRVESGHARGGYVDASGNTRVPILGPVLDGDGYAAIPDTDGGRLDADPVWDRAVGPTQFIPSTWRIYAADGNGDAIADPGNVYDATYATARHLCAGGLDLAAPANQRTAVLSYNHSDSYAATVLAYAAAYRGNTAAPPAVTVAASAVVAAPARVHRIISPAPDTLGKDEATVAGPPNNRPMPTSAVHPSGIAATPELGKSVQRPSTSAIPGTPPWTAANRPPVPEQCLMLTTARDIDAKGIYACATAIGSAGPQMTAVAACRQHDRAGFAHSDTRSEAPCAPETTFNVDAAVFGATTQLCRKLEELIQNFQC